MLAENRIREVSGVIGLAFRNDGLRGRLLPQRVSGAWKEKSRFSPTLKSPSALHQGDARTFPSYTPGCVAWRARRPNEPIRGREDT